MMAKTVLDAPMQLAEDMIAKNAELRLGRRLTEATAKF
jgi:hypothetical protein